MRLMLWLRRDTSTPTIPPPRVIFAGFDWSQTQKLQPTGAASLARIVEARYQPQQED